MKTVETNGRASKKIDAELMIGGVAVSGTSYRQVLESLTYNITHKDIPRLVSIATVNPEQVMLAQSDDAFRSIVNMFTYKLPDGAGLVWGLKWLAGRQGRRLDLKRIAGADLALDLVKVCLENNKRVFLLGGKPGVAGMAARFLPLPFTKGEVRRGLIESYLGSVDIKNETEPERKNTLDRISAFKPALLLVAFGAPYQEKWIGKNRKELEQAGVKVAMVVGGTFDYWTGTVKRAPQWMQQAGLEWFWRLVLEPWRIKRQMALVRFVGLVMKSWK